MHCGGVGFPAKAARLIPAGGQCAASHRTGCSKFGSRVVTSGSQRRRREPHTEGGSRCNQIPVGFSCTVVRDLEADGCNRRSKAHASPSSSVEDSPRPAWPPCGNFVMATACKAVRQDLMEIEGAAASPRPWNYGGIGTRTQHVQRPAGGRALTSRGVG
ncbi:hypothetical protein OBBRIDRAFT_509757 [Obba rivulosa]|uniref:Uncharacterized protein n=1 Tax=Obba rivulosa TaxID=1052685 RepID=A0A8E2DM61_9APHY|nr:hypothetical protein OBBRIDRAFT_509757 [Obba rivulosa]